MDPKRVVVHLLPIKPQPQFPPPPPPPQHSSSSTSFPILALSILGILTTSILLLSYYIFVIKCCLNWRHSDVIGRLSLSRSRMHRHRRRPSDYPLSAYSAAAAAAESRGLDESAIRSIPTFRYRKGGDSTTATATATATATERSSFNECAVCLNEFQEGERIRLLPNCLHLFHIDCIDTWLQSNANCPLCRSPITAINPVLAAHFTEHGNAHNPNRHDDTVIEVISSESHEQNHPQAAVASPRKGEELVGLKKGKRLHSVSSMGDECIQVRSEDENFCIQQMRRSFSMDSSGDKQLYLALQRILQKNPHFQEIRSAGAGAGDGESSSSSSSAGRGRRAFFSFGNHRSSRRAVKGPAELRGIERLGLLPLFFACVICFITPKLDIMLAIFEQNNI